MFLPDVVLRAGNRQPSVTKTFTVDGVAVNLTAATVRFRLTAISGGAFIVDQPATIVNATAGTVAYDWQAADASIAMGFYFGRFEATLAQGILTAPNDGWMVVHVTGLGSVGWSYSGDPSARDIDWVRFITGDTDETSASTLSDAEITALLTEEGDKWPAAVAACEIRASQFSQKSVMSKSVGDLSIAYDYGRSAEKMLDLAARLQSRATRHTKAAPIMATMTPRITSGQFDYQ